eukprot:2391027-Prymnesium_polylepis.2
MFVAGSKEAPRNTRNSHRTSTCDKGAGDKGLSQGCSIQDTTELNAPATSGQPAPLDGGGEITAPPPEQAETATPAFEHVAGHSSLIGACCAAGGVNVQPLEDSSEAQRATVA